MKKFLLLLIIFSFACAVAPVVVTPQATTLETAPVQETLLVPATTAPVSSTAATPGTGTVYYVRPDGGSEEQCTGLVDAEFPGSGTGQPCAWDHPFRALPPGGPARISGGDTLILAGGSYMMGYGAPGSEGICEPEGTWDCYLSPLPSGLDATHPTRFLGQGWDSGCTAPPDLWGTQRADIVLNLTGSSNVDLACLEVTDHSSCVEFHSGGLACERDTYPFGEWASRGLYAEDSTNVHIQNVDIHGLASTGVHAGRLADWTVENLRLAGNGLAGWDGDLWDAADANTGTLTFWGWVVEWNGCGETYPGGEPTGCWAQTAGGYGDGVGTGETGGDWIIEDSVFLHNTSDGLDLLYHTLGGTVTLNRVRAEGNAGNQVKVSGQASISNSVLVGNCAFFEGQPFTFDVDPCRALGSTLLLIFTGGEQHTIINSTLYGQGDGLVAAGPREGFVCNGNEAVSGWNNIFLGDTDFFDPGDIAFLFYQEGCSDLAFAVDYSLAYNLKNIEPPYVQIPFPSEHNLLADPLFNGPLTGAEYEMIPQVDSPAVDTGDEVHCPADDLLGNPRPTDGDGDGSAVCDMGAYEVWPADAWVFLPVIETSDN